MPNRLVASSRPRRPLATATAVPAGQTWQTKTKSCLTRLCAWHAKRQSSSNSRLSNKPVQLENIHYQPRDWQKQVVAPIAVHSGNEVKHEVMDVKLTCPDGHLSKAWDGDRDCD